MSSAIIDAASLVGGSIAVAAPEAICADQGGPLTPPTPLTGELNADLTEEVLQAKSLHRSGSLAAAETLYSAALAENPDNAEALHYFGLLRFQQGQGGAAVDLLYRSLAARPDIPEYYCNLGMVLAKSGRAAEALEVLDTALEMKPDFPEALDNRGTALDRLGKLDDAMEAWQRAIEINPGFAAGLTHLARGFSAKGDDDKALVLITKSLALNAHSGESHNQLGCLLRRFGRLDEASAAFRKATQLDPASPEAHSNLGTSLYELGETDRSRLHLEKAISIRSDYAEAHWNLALTLLISGDFDRGWLEYEWRRPTYVKKNPPRNFSHPEWNGCNIDGRTILLTSEQGLGDTLQFVRYVPMVAQRGAKVLLEVQPPLTEVLRPLKGAHQILGKGQPLPAFDVHARLMSLPGILGTRIATVPADVPYLAPDPHRQAIWKPRLSGPGFKVGIHWQGSKTFNTDRMRSIPLRCFEPLTSVHGVRLFSLQKNDGVEQIAQVADRFKVEEFDPPLDEGGSGAFTDTAAVMSHLDLVITCDTSVAHLAGALGVDVWVALNHGCDWRWLREREDSPWYPTMRLFRQKTNGDWDGVFQRIASALRDVVSADGISRCEAVMAPMAAGELLDRVSILQIKAQRLSDPVKVQCVRVELDALREVRENSLPHTEALSALWSQLHEINEQLWEIEDAIRAADAAGDFGSRFVELAKSVYRTNDRRAELKRAINALLGSVICDQKQYLPYENKRQAED